MRLVDVYDLFPCPFCKQSIKFNVKLKNGRSGKIWNDLAIGYPPESIAVGDEWFKVIDEEVEEVQCPFCFNIVFKRGVDP
jgi:protein-disulfide isomerase